jgi:hypothetical protein
MDNDSTSFAVLHRKEADAERRDVELRSRAAGCQLNGILISNSDNTQTAQYRAKYFWTHGEIQRRKFLKAIELRLHKLGVDEQTKSPKGDSGVELPQLGSF